MKRGRCPFRLRETPTLVGRRWFVVGVGSGRRYVSAVAAERMRKAYCDGWHRGKAAGAVEDRIGKRVAFREPGGPKGYILRMPGEG